MQVSGLVEVNARLHRLWAGTLIVLGLWMGLGRLTSVALAAGNLPRFETAPCQNGPADRTVACGFLVVPEDRSRPNSPEIKIAVAILKAGAPVDGMRPLVIVNGGPGGDALTDLPRFINTFPYLTADAGRDVIIFDQRGLGLSQPSLGCPELKDLAVQQARGQVVSDAALLAPYRACRDRWLAQGVDLSAYSTSASAADIHDLVQTLGLSKVDLYGISYGTVLAETVARDYPSDLHSLVLDSAYPLGVNLLADSAPNLHAGLERTFADCAADLACSTTFPDLAAVYRATVERLRAQPAQVAIQNKAETFQVPLSAAGFVGMFRLMPPYTIPAVIYNVASGDYSDVTPLLKTGIENAERYGPPPNRAMAYSILCAQHMYQVTDQPADSALAESDWAGQFVHRELLPLSCAEWPHAPPDPRDALPWSTRLPTLILRGANDATTSPDYDALLQATFVNARLLVVPGAGHGVLTTHLCSNTIVRAFFTNPERPPDTTCLNARPFQLDFRYRLRAGISELPVKTASAVLGLAIVWAGVAAARFAFKHPFPATLRHNLQRLGSAWPLGSAALTAIGLAGGWGFLGLSPAASLSAIVVPAASIHAAVLFAPEDEPALELALAASRPPVWSLIERWSVLAGVYGLIGLALSAAASALTGETLAVSVLRWLPALIVLTSLSANLSLIMGRAMLSVSLISLIWFAAVFLGPYMIQFWPFAWPLHLYAQPGDSFFWLNRLWLSLAGLGLVLNAGRLVKDEERLLFGRRGSSRSARAPTPAHGSRLADTPAEPAPWRQTVSVAGYEALLQLRRPGLAVFGLCLLIIPVINAFLGSQQLASLTASAAAGLTPPDYARTLVTNQILPITWLGGLGACAIVICILVADTLPRDRELGVSDLLAALPVGPGVYLFGKLLGVWMVLGAAVALSALVASLVNWLLIGPFNLAEYLGMWFAGIGALTVINSALTVLLTSGQPGNRRAVLLGACLAVVNLALLGAGVVFIRSGWSHWLTSRPALSLYYLFGYPGAALGAVGNNALAQNASGLTSWPAAMLDLAAGFIEVAIVGLAVWVWRRRGLRFEGRRHD